VKRAGIPHPSPGAATDTPGAATDTPGAASDTPGAATDRNANYLPQIEEWQEVEVVLQHQGKDIILYMKIFEILFLNGSCAKMTNGG
jgi:hypothetical protein